MKWYIIFLIILKLNLTTANYTFTYNMAASCKEHICKHGYNYDTFYRIDPQSRELEPGVLFELHIAILAPSNGHILLSTVSEPKVNDPVYEFVVGGGGNKFSELRRNRGRNAKVSVKTVGILSTIDYRAFYIRLSDEGLVELGLEGESLPLLNYFDLDPITINYFSFAAWNGEQAKFLYDCPVANENITNAAADSKIVDRPMSASDKLKGTLMSDRASNLAPSPVVTVRLGMKVTTIDYNAFDSRLNTGLAVVMSWNDDSMAWNPNKFNNTTTLKFRQGEIWKPVFYVHNSDKIAFLDSQNSEPIYMLHSGEATLNLQTKITTWCDDNATFLSNWPRDEYSCSIEFGPWALHEKIEIEFMDPNDIKIRTFVDGMEVISTEFEIMSVIQKAIEDNTDDDFNGKDKVTITVNIRRRPGAYNVVFYTPLLVLHAFLLISFWTESLNMSRVWFYAGITVLICMGLSYIDYLVPSHKLPSVVVLYVYVLFGALLALLTQVLMIHPSVQSQFKKASAQNFITNKTLRLFCCLPPIKTCNIYEAVNDGYSNNDDDSGVVTAPRYGNLEEMTTDDENIDTGDKKEFAEVVDKIMFTIYSIVFALLLALHY